MVNIPPLENLNYNIGCNAIECVCPNCGVIHKRIVELKHKDSHYAWRRSGYLVINCKSCRKEGN